MFEEIAEILAEQLGISKDKIKLESDIVKDLGADSLDVVELLMTLEDNTGKTIPEDRVTEVKTVEDVVNLIKSL
ncbi:MAG: acyl carrier protein [Clostridia bacterium]|jgi:acyl carrier protein|nr:acyl carrier protein [Clostridia bacterium]